MKDHNFKEMKEYKHPDKQRFWCRNCDSIVQYPRKKRYTESDVNYLTNNSKLRCMPPLAGDYKE